MLSPDPHLISWTSYLHCLCIWYLFLSLLCVGFQLHLSLLKYDKLCALLQLHHFGHTPSKQCPPYLAHFISLCWTVCSHFWHLEHLIGSMNPKLSCFAGASNSNTLLPLPPWSFFCQVKALFRFLNSSFLVPLRGFPLTPCCSPFPHFHYFSNLFVTLDHLQCFFNLGLIVTPYHHVSIVLNLSIFYFLYLSSDDFCQYMLFTPPPLNLSATFNDNTLL